MNIATDRMHLLRRLGFGDLATFPRFNLTVKAGEQFIAANQDDDGKGRSKLGRATEPMACFGRSYLPFTPRCFRWSL